MTARTESPLNRVKFRGLTGSGALVLAVIGKAVDDALGGDSAARAYFALPEYRAHLFWLSLDTDWLPLAFEENGLGKT